MPTDLLAQGRWTELIQWMGGRRAALKTACSRTLAMAHRPWAMARVRCRSREFIRSDFLRKTLTAEGKIVLAPHLGEAYPWEIDDYVPQHTSIRHRILAVWVAVRAEEETHLADFHGIEKAFPILDVRLIAALLHQDPVLFGEGTTRDRLQPILFMQCGPIRHTAQRPAGAPQILELVSRTHQPSTTRRSTDPGADAPAGGRATPNRSDCGGGADLLG